MTGIERVVILNDFASHQGGAGYLAGALAAGLAARRTPVTLLTADAGGGDAQGVEHVALGGKALLDSSTMKGAIAGLYNREMARGVTNLIKRHDTPNTIYHLHNWSNIFSPSVFDALAPVAGRTIIHAHDYFLACPNGAYLDYPRAAVCTRTPLSRSCIFTQCDKRAEVHKIWRVARQGVLNTRLKPHLDQATFVAIHPQMEPLLNRAIQPRRLTSIRNPVSPFGPVVTAPERQHGIVHIGQVQRLKGVYELAEAADQLDLIVDFFGGGEDLDDLRQRHPRHRFHGWTDRDTLALHLQGARLAVAASQSPEPFCLAAFEVVATGVPLLISDALLAAHELVEAGAALPFSAADAKALKIALKTLMTDDDLVRDLASAARIKGSTLGHGLDGWIDSHLALYARVLGRATSHTSEGEYHALA